jgi:FkbM family methyltransferase
LVRVTARMLAKKPRRLWGLFRFLPRKSAFQVLDAIEGFRQRSGSLMHVRVRGLPDPVALRQGTTDLAVFLQVFVDRQYDCAAAKSGQYVLDAGANIGLASIFFLAANPACRVVAVEPDPENCELAALNLRPFGDRCRLVQGAVWACRQPLELSRGTFRDGGHWASQTLPISRGKGNAGMVQGYEVGDLIADFPQVDLLKMDVEGAELAVFRDGDVSWLEKTRCCAVECHGDECADAVLKALDRYGFRHAARGEVLFAWKPTAVPPSAPEIGP